MNKWYEIGRAILFDRRFLGLLFVINVLGSLYGYYWYREQLAATPLIYWPFIPDSPLSTTMFALTLYFLLRGRQMPLLFFLASATVIKYGLWAVFANTQYWVMARTVHWQEVMLWLSHAGMAVQGFLYLIYLPPSWKEWAIISLWMVWNDYVDYSWLIHPYLYLAEQLPIIAYFTYGLTTAIIIFSACLAFVKLRYKAGNELFSEK